MTRTLSLNQKEFGYRYNRDSFLLADFYRDHEARRIIDFGAGVGVVSILVAMNNPSVFVMALEINPELARLAMDNARRNGMENYHVIIGDMMTTGRMFREGVFDAVVSNPPYRRAGSGKVNPDPIKAVARHELRMTMDGMIAAASKILRPGGSITISMIHERLNEYRRSLAKHGFCETRRRAIRSFDHSAPNLFLSEARLGVEAPLEIMPPFTLKTVDNDDSDEFKSVIARYV